MGETIKVLEEFIKYYEVKISTGKYIEENLTMVVDEFDIKAIETLLQAYKEDERVIKEMNNWINDNTDPFTGCYLNGKCIDRNIPCKDCIERCFRNKVREENK